MHMPVDQESQQKNGVVSSKKMSDILMCSSKRNTGNKGTFIAMAMAIK